MTKLFCFLNSLPKNENFQIVKEKSAKINVFSLTNFTTGVYRYYRSCSHARHFPVIK